MTYKDFVDILKSTNMPVAFNAFEIGSVPSLPYIVYTNPSNNDFIADNQNYVNVARMNVELYSKRRNFTTERTLENVLKANNIVYDKSSVWLETEEMQETLYEMEIVIE